MKKFNTKIISATLASLISLTTSVPAFAATYNNPPSLEGISTIEKINSNNKFAENSRENINFIEITDNYLEYTELRNDGMYKIKENINGTDVSSKVYKMVNGKEILYSSISSHLEGQTVKSTEYNYINGKTETSTLKAEISENKTVEENQLLSRSTYKKYIRTDRYGVSLVGKKVSVGAAAAAIVAVTPYVGISVAAKIITTAIVTGTGGGVASLPNYLYVTSNVYRTKSSVGKYYTRYENTYYLDSKRTQRVGSWTFSKRG